MFTQMKDHLAKQLAEIKANGLYKVERTIITPQSSAIRIAERSGKVLNFCANNYLGLSDNPRLISAAKKAMDSHGFGMSSVRFICGAQDLHRELEKAIARYFHTEDTILYAACFDANGGVVHRRGCHHLGCAQPCIDHRRRAPLQSQTLSLRQC